MNMLNVPALPTHEITPSAVQLFAFSAVTWNPHRIHFDAPYARDVEGYPNVVVHGPLLGSWLMQVAEEWMRGWGVVDSITYRSTVALTLGNSVTITGAVTAESATGAAADVWAATADGTRVCEGHVVAARTLAVGPLRHY